MSLKYEPSSEPLHIPWCLSTSSSSDVYDKTEVRKSNDEASSFDVRTSEEPFSRIEDWLFNVHTSGGRPVPLDVSLFSVVPEGWTRICLGFWGLGVGFLVAEFGVFVCGVWCLRFVVWVLGCVVRGSRSMVWGLGFGFCGSRFGGYPRRDVCSFGRHPRPGSHPTPESRNGWFVFRPPFEAVLTFENNCLAQGIDVWQPLPRFWRGPGAPVLRKRIFFFFFITLKPRVE